MGRKKKKIWGEILLQGLKFSYFQKLMSEAPLSLEERKQIAEFFCPEFVQKSKEKGKVGRPRGSDTTYLRNFEIAKRYMELYVPGGSESAYEQLKTEMGFKDISSVKKAIKPFLRLLPLRK